MRLTLKLARLSARLGVPNSAIGKMVTTRPASITWLDVADLSGLDTSVGNPFHYERPKKSSGALEEQQKRVFGMNSRLSRALILSIQGEKQKDRLAEILRPLTVFWRALESAKINVGADGASPGLVRRSTPP